MNLSFMGKFLGFSPPQQVEANTPQSVDEIGEYSF
jgi:hypothetical protein